MRVARHIFAACFIALLSACAVGDASIARPFHGGVAATGGAPPPAEGLQITFSDINGGGGASYVYHCDDPGSDTPYTNLYVTCQADGSVNVHLGGLWNTGSPTGLSADVLTPTADFLHSYHAKVEDETDVLYETDVENHWWNAEWNYRPSAIASLRTPAQIVSAHLAFKYGTISGVTIGTPTATAYSILGASNITVYMPTTGERADIGLVTDVSAYFMITGDATKMNYWALAAASEPAHVRDDVTGKPINLLTYPNANMADGPGLQGAPWIPKGPCYDNNSDNPTYGTIITCGYTGFGFGSDTWTPQQAHHPELSYMAYVASGDIGFLRDLQYAANYLVVEDGANRFSNKADVYGEMRGMGWGLRSLCMAHTATVDAETRGVLPSNLHDSDYWATLLHNQLQVFEAYESVSGNGPFHIFGYGPTFGPWQQEYILQAMAFCVLTGHTEWEDIYVWGLKNTIMRMNGTSGWPPGYGGPYYVHVAPDGDPTNFYDSWTDAWDAFKGRTGEDEPNLTGPELAALAMDPLNGGHALRGYEYLMATRAVLIEAQYLDDLGIVDVRGVYADLDDAADNAHAYIVDGGNTNPRQAVVLP